MSAMMLVDHPMDWQATMAQDASLSPEEEEVCGCVSVNRMNLSSFLEDFALAVQLFDLLERGGGPPSVGVFGGVFINYRMIAAKEGAMNIFHFRCSLEALRRQVVMCPRTRGIVDVKRLKKAASHFNQQFPHAENVRNAVAHAGEIWASTKTAREHRQQRDYTSPQGSFSAAGSFLSAMLTDRTFSIGWKGAVFEVRMHTETANELAKITVLALSAFPRLQGDV